MMMAVIAKARASVIFLNIVILLALQPKVRPARTRPRTAGFISGAIRADGCVREFLLAMCADRVAESYCSRSAEQYTRKHHTIVMRRIQSLITGKPILPSAGINRVLDLS